MKGDGISFSGTVRSHLFLTLKLYMDIVKYLTFFTEKEGEREKREAVSYC